jgi:antitoxin component of MazEF toxin-antitoxin module
MRTRVATWGHSFAVRIPRALAKQFGVREGSAVEITATGDGLLIRKPGYTLGALLEGVTPDNLHDAPGGAERTP